MYYYCNTKKHIDILIEVIGIYEIMTIILIIRC